MKPGALVTLRKERTGHLFLLLRAAHINVIIWSSLSLHVRSFNCLCSIYWHAGVNLFADFSFKCNPRFRC